MKALIADVGAKSVAFGLLAKRDPGLAPLYAEYTPRLKAFLDVGGRVLAAHAAGDRETALTTMFNECIPDAAALRQHLQKVRGTVRVKARTLEHRMAQGVKDAERQAALLFAAALVFALGLARLLARRVIDTRRAVCTNLLIPGVRFARIFYASLPRTRSRFAI